jgi:hypothetical protein
MYRPGKEAETYSIVNLSTSLRTKYLGVLLHLLAATRQLVLDFSRQLVRVGYIDVSR